MVVLEVAVASWFVEDNETLVWLKTFPLGRCYVVWHWSLG